MIFSISNLFIAFFLHILLLIAIDFTVKIKMLMKRMARLCVKLYLCSHHP